MNSLGCLGGPGFFGSGRVRVGPAMVWAGLGPGLRICGPGRPIARLAPTPPPVISLPFFLASDLSRYWVKRSSTISISVGTASAKTPAQAIVWAANVAGRRIKSVSNLHVRKKRKNPEIGLTNKRALRTWWKRKKNEWGVVWWFGFCRWTDGGEVGEGNPGEERLYLLGAWI